MFLWVVSKWVGVQTVVHCETHGEGIGLIDFDNQRVIAGCLDKRAAK